MINDDAFLLAATADACTMVHLVSLFMKPNLLALLQDNCLDVVHVLSLVQGVWMREEYNSVLSTPAEAADKIGSAVLADTDMSASANISVYLNIS